MPIMSLARWNRCPKKQLSDMVVSLVGDDLFHQRWPQADSNRSQSLLRLCPRAVIRHEVLHRPVQGSLIDAEPQRT